jgi:hypothetical protein
MNATWLLVGLGVHPLDNSSVGLVNAFMKNLPATIPLSMMIGSQMFMLFAMFFAMIAITTVYLANGMGLISASPHPAPAPGWSPGPVSERRENDVHRTEEDNCRPSTSQVAAPKRPGL